MNQEAVQGESAKVDWAHLLSIQYLPSFVAVEVLIDHEGSPLAVIHNISSFLVSMSMNRYSIHMTIPRAMTVDLYLYDVMNAISPEVCTLQTINEYIIIEIHSL